MRTVCYDVLVWVDTFVPLASSCPQDPGGHLARACAGHQVGELRPWTKWNKSIPAPRKTHPYPTADWPMSSYL